MKMEKVMNVNPDKHRNNRITGVRRTLAATGCVLALSLSATPLTSQAVVVDSSHSTAVAGELPVREFLDTVLSKEVMSPGKKTKTKIAFSIDKAGPYELRLEESGLYDDIKKLKAKVISDGKVIAKLKGPGALEFETEPGEYLLKIKSKIGKKEEGMFYTEVAGLADTGLPTAVPLPPAILLFGSALVALAGFTRRKGRV
jgi:hypothetical protein